MLRAPICDTGSQGLQDPRDRTWLRRDFQDFEKEIICAVNNDDGDDLSFFTMLRISKILLLSQFALL